MDLSRSSSPTSLIRLKYLEEVARNLVQTVFEYLQGYTPQPLWAICDSAWSPSQYKKAFPAVQAEPPVFQFLPIASCPVTSHYRKDRGSIFFTPFLQILMYIDEISLTLLCSRLNCPTCLSLFL